MEKRRWRVVFKLSVVMLLFCFLSAFPAYAADDAILERLEKIIQQQQEQIAAQQKALEQLQGEVNALKGQTGTPTDSPDTVMTSQEAVIAGETAKDSKMAGGAGDAEEGPDKIMTPEEAVVAGATAEEGRIIAEAAKEGPNVVEAQNPNAKVVVYGQVNKAVLYSNDGDKGNFYLVDNDNSSTRVGLVGAIEPAETFKIGTRIEVEYQTNPSNLVSQENRRISDADFEERHLDLWVNTQSFGKFSLGWGSTASDGTSEMDLSGTGVIGYSSIGDMAGGQLFYDNSTNSLSSTAIRNVYSNMDGLGRDERIRYDSPSFHGLTGSASYISDGGGDLAVRYLSQFSAFKLAAAAAYANPGSTSDSIDDQLAGSVSVLHDSGFSGTFALGTRDYKVSDRDGGGFFYAKFGYRANWFPLGDTLMSLDAGRYSDISANGDDADTFGFQMVQDLQRWGSEAYLGYRFHKLDRNATDYNNINAIMTGMRVKF